MRTFLTALGTVAMLTTGILSTTAPASADGYYRGDGWGHGHRYYRHHGRDGFDGGDALAAGAIGLGVGALLGGALSDNRPGYYVDQPQYRYYDGPTYYQSRVLEVERPVRYREVPVYRGRYNHVAACEARYRSYDRRSDTFVGYDGYAHRCNL